MMKLTILEPLGISNDQLEKHINQFEKTGYEVDSYDTQPKSDEEKIERCKDAEIVILVNTSFSRAVIEQCKNLKMLSIAFTGFDHVDTKYAKEKSIAVTNAAGYATDSVAELTFGLIFSLYRQIIEGNEATRKEGTRAGLLGTELKGKTLGIVGTGAIGSRVAELGNVFGCKLIGYNRSEKNACKELGLKYTSLNSLLGESDIVSIHLPLNDETKDLISEKELAMIKKNAILIHTARGGVVNEEALADVLNQGKIAGAGIDVFGIEPPLPKDHVLIQAKNTVLTPHVAFATTEALVKRADIAFGNIEAWLADKPKNLVN